MGATSLLPEAVETMIEGFAGQMVPTVLALIAILVPVGLTLWAIGFGVNKALDFFQSKAEGAIK